MTNVFYMNHPLLKHKITMLRDERTGTNQFRKLVEEIAMLMGYEALSDLKTRNTEIKTPIEETIQPILDGRKPAVVPILRAGLGMVDGILALIVLIVFGVDYDVVVFAISVILAFVFPCVSVAFLAPRRYAAHRLTSRAWSTLSV